MLEDSLNLLPGASSRRQDNSSNPRWIVRSRTTPIRLVRRDSIELVEPRVLNEPGWQGRLDGAWRHLKRILGGWVEVIFLSLTSDTKSWRT